MSQRLAVGGRALGALRLPFALAGALSLSCGAPAEAVGSGSEPAGGGGRVSIDPTAPGASIVCTSEEQGASLFVLSAMNHKLQTYPEFAQAIGLELVSDCESAARYSSGYEAYSAEHVDFDADEPLPPSSEVEPSPPSGPPSAPEEVQKIAGGEDGIVNHPIVNISFKTCSMGNCPNADTSWIVTVPGSTPVDLRRHPSNCTGTFIAKNWILTAAHCVTLVALDTCMEHGDKLSECTPTWDTWGFWTIRGTRPNQVGPQDTQLWARAYVMGGWVGRSLLHNRATCTTPNCFDPDLTANDDLALLYLPTDFDEDLFPRIEDNGAKRLSLGTPASDWQLAFYGWGQPLGTDPQTGQAQRVLRRGADFFDQFNVLARRIDVVSTTSRPFPCAGDSGGPTMHVGLELDTNNGVQSGLEAIVGVSSVAQPPCGEPPLPGPGQAVTWSSTRVDHPEHRKFILDSMRRYHSNFSCTSRGLVGLEADECWGPPCSNNSRPADGGCPLATQTCVNPGREITLRKGTAGGGFPTCSACNGSPQQGSCDCIVGQCLPL